MAQGVVRNKMEEKIRRWRKMPMRLLVVAGRRKSGKDVLVDYIMKHYRGFTHYRIAEAPVLIAKILELPPDRKVQQALFGVNELLRPLLGESVYKRRVARLLDRERPRNALVEAIRPKEEYEEFVVKREGILIGVTAPDRMRYARALRDAKHSAEKRDEGNMTFREFMAHERVPIERDIDWIVARAHFILENNYTRHMPFHRLVDAVMQELGFQKTK